ncbi:MAG: hypothetical protein K6E58_03100 [Eubacterium sp.]|nr:hypothetical protein [Eubacterium sp.]
MANVDIKDLEFRKPNEEEKKVIKKNLLIHNSKVFLIRFIILLVLLIIVMAFQYFGQFSRIQDYSWKAFLSRQWLFYIIFIVLNIISAIPLIYASTTVKSLDFHRFIVNKKMKVNESSNRYGGGLGGMVFSPNEKYKYLIVSDAESDDNVTGKVLVSGPMEYSSVREGDEIIAEKVPYRNHFRYYYVTAMYTKR